MTQWVDERDVRFMRYQDWHRWFASFPVRLDGCFHPTTACDEYVERKLNWYYPMSRGGLAYSWSYRATTDQTSPPTFDSDLMNESIDPHVFDGDVEVRSRWKGGPGTKALRLW